MNKLKSFLMGFILLIMTFIIIVLVALIYRANDRMSVKSYIFQVNNFANQRVGELQNINDISDEDLRNKLIKKYISEYFKVIPGETDIENRPVLYMLSTPNARKQWQNGEAKNIAQMSAKNMFRMVHVPDDGIATLNRPADYNYKDAAYQKIYYSVRYYMQTWKEAYKIGTNPVFEQGTINIEAVFQPGIVENMDIQKYLEKGYSPAGLFNFKVTNIGNKEF